MDKIFKLFPSCSVVSGKNGLALYDLRTGDIYDLDDAHSTALFNYNKHLDAFMVNSDLGYIYDEFVEKGIGILLNTNVVMTPISRLISKPIEHASKSVNTVNTLFVEITNECNLSCSFCKENTINRSTTCKKFDLKRNQLVSIPQQFELIIHQLAHAKNVGVKNLILLGGEPFLFNDALIRLVEEGKKFDFKITIFTNASLPVGAHILAQMKRNNIELLVQIIATDDQLGERITSLPNYWSIVKENIIAFKRANIPVAAQIIVGNFNENLLPNMVKQLQDICIDKINLRVLYPVPDNKFAPINFQKYIGKSAYLYRLTAEKINSLADKEMCFSRYMAISADGFYMPCPSMRYALGDLYESSITKILSDENYKYFRDLSKDKIAHCQQCKYRYGCFDCRAVEAYATQSFFGKKFCEEIINGEL